MRGPAPSCGGCFDFPSDVVVSAGQNDCQWSPLRFFHDAIFAGRGLSTTLRAGVRGGRTAPGAGDLPGCDTRRRRGPSAVLRGLPDGPSEGVHGAARGGRRGRRAVLPAAAAGLARPGGDGQRRPAPLRVLLRLRRGLRPPGRAGGGPRRRRGRTRHYERRRQQPLARGPVPDRRRRPAAPAGGSRGIGGDHAGRSGRGEEGAAAGPVAARFRRGPGHSGRLRPAGRTGRGRGGAFPARAAPRRQERGDRPPVGGARRAFTAADDACGARRGVPARSRAAGRAAARTAARHGPAGLRTGGRLGGRRHGLRLGGAPAGYAAHPHPVPRRRPRVLR